MDCPTSDKASEQELRNLKACATSSVIILNANQLEPVKETSEPIPVKEKESVVCVNKKLPETCNCNNTSPVDSRTVLKVLLNQTTCERHKAIGREIENYIILKVSQHTNMFSTL